MTDVYAAADRLVGELVDATAPQSVVVFSLGGMGSNNSDIPSMVLLPELFFRWATGNHLLNVPHAWTDDPTVVPIIPENQTWQEALNACLPRSTPLVTQASHGTGAPAKMRP